MAGDYRLVPASADPATRQALRMADLESRLSRIEALDPDKMARAIFAYKGAALTGTQHFVFNGGIAPGPFINGISESNSISLAHGLGVVPFYISIQGMFTDGGRFSTYIASYDATNINWFVRDMAGLGHGPGNLGAIWPWFAVGISST